MTRVALLAPMRPELGPLVDLLSLERAELGELPVRSGRAGNVDVVATVTGIGMGPAAETTRRLLGVIAVDHVMVVGIAGGVGPAVDIGDLVVPEVVVDGPSGIGYRPHHVGDVEPRGTIVSSDEFGYADEVIARFVAQGVVALDMETAAIAMVCERHGCPWTVFRAISDRGDDETVDREVLELAGPDGRGNRRALARYLARRPQQVVHLARLAKGTRVATRVAAAAAIRACEWLPG